MGIAKCIQYISTCHKIPKILLSCPVYYIHFTTCVDPYPGKKEKHFEYAKGLPPDVVKSDSMGDKSFTYENEISINNSISYIKNFFYLNTPQWERYSKGKYSNQKRSLCS